MIEMTERRKHKRYPVKDGTFALLRSTSIEFSKVRDMSMGQIAFAVIKSKPVKMGQIKNISMNGLAFDYIESQGKAIKVFKLDILLAQSAFYLGKLLFKPVFDYVINSEIPLNTFTMRRCGVEFGELTSRQKAELDHFVNHHTLMQEQMSDDSLLWGDDSISTAADSIKVASIIQ